MYKLNEAKTKVQVLRNEMHKLIEQKKDLLSPEIIQISQKLDKTLIQYYKVKLKAN